MQDLSGKLLVLFGRVTKFVELRHSEAGLTPDEKFVDHEKFLDQPGSRQLGGSKHGANGRHSEVVNRIGTFNPTVS